jgi:hypothetical protein
LRSGSEMILRAPLPPFESAATEKPMSVRAIITVVGVVLAASLLTQSDTIARGGGGSHGGRNGGHRAFNMRHFFEAHHGNEHRQHDDREYREHNERDAHSNGGRWSDAQGGHGPTAHRDNGAWSQGSGFGDMRAGRGLGFGDTNVGRRPSSDGEWHAGDDPQ